MADSAEGGEPVSEKPPSAWLLGVILSVVVLSAAIYLPASAWGPEDAGIWFLRTLEQVALNFATDGWPMLALSVGALTVVVAIVAFVGSAPWTVLSDKKRTTLHDTAWFFMVFATGVAAIVSAALLLPVAPALRMEESAPLVGTDSDAAQLVFTGLGAQSRLVLLGFLGVAALVCCKYAEHALNAWIMVDKDDATREESALKARLEARKKQRTAAIAQRGQVWESDTKTRAFAVMISTLVFVVCAGGSALSGYFVRVLSEHPADLSSLVTVALVLGAPHSALVGVAVHEWRKSQWTTSVKDARGTKWWERPRARRWAVGVAASVMPVFLIAMFALVVETWGWLQILTCIVFLAGLVVPAVVMICFQRKYSWKAVAVRNAIDELTGSIDADTQRLAILASTGKHQPQSS